MSSLSDEFREALEATLTKVLNDKRSIDNETHQLDHEYIALKRERSKIWERRIEKFKLGVIGGLATAVVGALGAGLVFLGKVVVNYYFKHNS